MDINKNNPAGNSGDTGDAGNSGGSNNNAGNIGANLGASLGSLAGAAGAAAAGGNTTEYEVQKGDTLSAIGKRFGVPWREIYEANRDQINDPDMIQVGWKLKIPSK